MRRVVLILAALAVVGFATSRAHAGHGRHGPSVNYGYRYQPARAGFYSPAPYFGYPGLGPRFQIQPHSQAVRRIKAAHSRYRYRTHPRSQYNSPPHPYDYFGW